MVCPTKLGPLKQSELADADRIVRLAFGTFLGLPNPLDFMGDRNFVTPRWHSSNVKAIAARDEGRGVAQRLLEATMKIFDGWGVRHTGLFTFAQSAKQVALYQKFGYWPRYLTAVLTRTPASGCADAPALLSPFTRSQREQAIQACGKLTGKEQLRNQDEVAAVYTRSGAAAAARRSAQLKARTYRGDNVDAFLVAAQYGIAGDKEKALEWLNRAARMKGGANWFKLRYPVFDFMRSDPRCQDLVRRIGLAP